MAAGKEANLDSNDIQVKNGHVTISEGVKLYYELRTPGGHIPAGTSTDKLVMIMGAFATLKHFEEQANTMVSHFAKSGKPIEILTYDHRGIGKSVPALNRARQTTQMLANDCLKLLNEVWGDTSTSHVYGASLGGMVAQELAVSLVKANRLRSLYLVVTSRGTFVRPMAAITPSAWSVLVKVLIKDDREKMIREVLLPASFSPETLDDQGEKYAQIWLSNYEDWWAFHDRAACANQATAAASHYLTNDNVGLIRNSKVPITVQIATKDKLMPVDKQRQLATLLNANTIVFDQGHMGDDKVKAEVFRAAISHLENAMRS